MGIEPMTFAIPVQTFYDWATVYETTGNWSTESSITQSEGP